MAQPPTYDFPVWKGNTTPIRVRFKLEDETPIDLTGSTVVFRAAWGSSGAIRLVSGTDSEVDLTEAAEGEVTITLSASHTREIPKGRIARYEIERRIDGVQTTLVYGFLNATEWVNDDV